MYLRFKPFKTRRRAVSILSNIAKDIVWAYKIRSNEKPVGRGPQNDAKAENGGQGRRRPAGNLTL